MKQDYMFQILCPLMQNDKRLKTLLLNYFIDNSGVSANFISCYLGIFTNCVDTGENIVIQSNWTNIIDNKYSHIFILIDRGHIYLRR